jgi:hypothetical protein
MFVMIGADIDPTGGKFSRHVDSSLNPFLSRKVALSSQVLIDSLPDQVGDRSSCRRGGMPKSFKLTIG